MRDRVRRFFLSFSATGLALGTLFFAASLTPSLLPRTYVTQGLLSGVAMACGYGLGVLLSVLWFWLELQEPKDRVRLWLKAAAGGLCGLVVLVGWSLLSVFWSTDATTSFLSWITTAALAFLAIVIGHIRDTLQTARALGDVLRVLLAVSLGVEVLSGVLLDLPFRFLGIQGNLAQLGPVQGIFGTRNMLGFVAVLALITFLIEWRTQSVRPGVSITSVVLAGGLAALSDSPTVLVLAVGVGLSVGALAWVRHTRPQHRGALQLALGAAVVIGVAVGYFARHPIIAWLGAGTDFSMRVDLWNVMVDLVRSRPVQGWGWYGAWAPAEQPFSFINYFLESSHATGLNAYFDVLLQLGWVGLILLIALAATALVRSWLAASERRSVIYAWTPLILIALLIDSMFESFTLVGIGWLMLVLCAVRAGLSRSWR